MEQGTDVSRYQGTVDWNAVRNAGVTFAILRAGYGRYPTQQDPTFAANYAGATAAGLDVGAYWYSYAADTAGVQAEARACLSVLGGRRLPLGVWFDQEYEPAILALSKNVRTGLVQRFLRTMEDAGYIAGLYCSADWLRTKLDTAAFVNENLWIAQYADTYTGPLAPNIWQYTSTGRVPGVTGNVDRDLLYTRPAVPGSTGAQGTLGPMPDLGPTTLRKGSRGRYVRNLQQVLNALGYNSGTVDGIFGTQTRKAVRNFQRAAGLVVDGVAGPATKAALTARWQEV